MKRLKKLFFYGLAILKKNRIEKRITGEVCEKFSGGSTKKKEEELIH